ncbi:MAG TPA: twin-arginine translocase TatA/TatE family subunit [Actinomycetes bacterium]|jgi:sec-independent protein translocase protein TatA
MPGGPELIWVIIVIVVLFGASRLPAMGRNLGLGIKEFKKGVGEATRDGKDKGEADRSPEADERDRGPTA